MWEIYLGLNSHQDELIHLSVDGLNGDGLWLGRKADMACVWWQVKL